VNFVAEIKRRVSRERAWRAWSGTIEELGRIAQLISELFDARKIELVAVHRRSLGLNYDDKSNESKSSEERYAESELRQYEESFSFAVTVVQGGDSVTGSFEDIKDEIDRRSVSEILFSCQYPYSTRGETLILRMKWKVASPPVTLEISSADVGWANQAFARLSSEVDKGRPAFSWMASGIMGHVIVSLLMNILMVLTFASIFFRISPGIWGPITAAGIGFAAALLFAFLDSHRQVFPAVEIVEAGVSSTLPRRMAYLGGIAVAITTGAVINILV
jgi:hypothetical protein